MNVGDIDFCKLYYIHVDLIGCFHLISFYNDYAAATPSDFIKCSLSHIAKMSTSHIHSWSCIKQVHGVSFARLQWSYQHSILCCNLHHFVSKLQLYNTISTLQHKSTIPGNYIRIHNTYNYNPNYRTHHYTRATRPIQVHSDTTHGTIHVRASADTKNCINQCCN